MEKQLELKEANTRRKILALKQQLQSGNKPPLTAPAKQSVHTVSTPVDVKAHIPTSKSEQVILSPNRQQLRTDESSHFNDSPTQMPHLQDAVSTSMQENNKTQAELRIQQASERTKQSVLAENNNPSPTQITRASPNIVKTDPSSNKEVTNSSTQQAASQVLTISPVSSCSKTPQPKSRQKLTLPDEIKETEYMSAIQRQKARVSRIRRCIVAATVIQRAWRDYRAN